MRPTPITALQARIYATWLSHNQSHKAAAKALNREPEQVRQTVARVQRKLSEGLALPDNAPNTENPACPSCGHSPTKRRGKTTAGTQRYQCPACGKSWTGTPHGATRKHDDGLTAQQRYDRKNRARISEQQRKRRARKKDPGIA